LVTIAIVKSAASIPEPESRRIFLEVRLAEKETALETGCLLFFTRELALAWIDDVRDREPEASAERFACDALAVELLERGASPTFILRRLIATRTGGVVGSVDEWLKTLARGDPDGTEK
jgi:hypothetical protein